MSENEIGTLIGELSKIPFLNLKTDLQWKNVTTLGVGGNIPVLVEPENDIALVKVLKTCRAKKIKVLVVGAGSNIVGSDAPFDGVLIRLCRGDFVKIAHGRKHITAGTGARLRDFVVSSAELGFGGYAPLAAVPATIGGALRMNAGADGVSIGTYLAELCGFDMNGEPWSSEAKKLTWGYRYSSLPEDIIITGVIFSMPQADPAEEKTKIDDAIKKRREKEPSGRSAGCVFRNVAEDTPAGKLIDLCGCKSMKCGDLSVSDKHANYFINAGNGTEKDFVDLMCSVRKTVFEKTGIYLDPEVCFADHASLEKVRSTPPRRKAAVLKGGTSSEREVSLESGAAVAMALRKAGWIVTELDIKTPEVSPEMKEVDVVFPVLHGGFGENGEIQKALENAGLKFIGSGSAASTAIMDKVASKKIMDANGIPTPPSAVLTKENRKRPESLKLPVIMKPPLEGSTVGISIVSTEEEWEAALDNTLKYGETVLVEKYIDGKETTVGIIDGNALPVIEIRYPGKMYDYDAKYLHEKGETLYLCPPESIDEATQKKVQETGVAFYKASGARDILRVDIMIDRNDGSLYVLEGNNLPGFTSSSLVPKASKVAGRSFIQLCAGLAVKAVSR